MVGTPGSANLFQPEAGARPPLLAGRAAGRHRTAEPVSRDSFPGRCVWAAADQASATSNAVMFRVSLLNSTPTRWIGSPRLRYFAA